MALDAPPPRLIYRSFHDAFGLHAELVGCARSLGGILYLIAVHYANSLQIELQPESCSTVADFSSGGGKPGLRQL